MTRVVVDSREQRPYAFAGSVRKALPAGDYSLEGLENQFAIERKSLDDFVSTVVRDGKRFAVELRKLQGYDLAFVIIEGSVSEILSGGYVSKIHPQALLGMTTKLMLDYQPVHFLFCHDRPHAYAVVSRLLELTAQKFAKGHPDGNRAEDA